ncbi:phage tail tip lysozyme [Methylobacterium brachiatum]|uniref:phage tail tip lysozyme n=1 Tax=Methylobacterium brachiatum TaxID=269660 RepID=UPI0008E11A7F|nr:phage tail tip lysozyme [Methylobacterium brachiatum]SFJ67862.1 hypothetical protein SAMN02799642_05142 [Methylobacterium brachiatum]
MADEALRMQAEVQDKFTGPLKALRAQLLDVTRTGANHSETLAKGFKGVEGAMQSTARTASSLINPAFAALGVTGLTAGAAVAGISSALNKLTGNLSGLGQLSRETGVAAKTLQEFGAVAGRFGIEQDAVANGARNFAAQMRLFSRSTGEAFQWVVRQGTDAAGRKAFQDFATDLQRTTDEGEKLKKALAFMETIRNPVERGIFAQQFFGNQDLGRLADGHLGKVVDLFKKAREKIGVFNPDDILNADKFDRSISDLKGSMSRFGLLIARELLGPATQFTTWINELVSDQRGDLLKGLREGLEGVKKELGEINFKQAGDDAVAFLKESTALAGSMARAFHEVAEAIHAIRNGNPVAAARGLDGASGPLARKFAPRVGDDEIAAQEEVDRLRKLKDLASEAQGHFIGRTQQRLGLIGTPEQAGKNLEDAEARLKALQGRTPEQRQKDFESSDKLRRSIDTLTDEMKASRSGATVQKQSMDTQGGLFGGATIQSAAFGGSGFRRFGGGVSLPPSDGAPQFYGGPQAERRGGSGPGYAGERGPAGPGAGRVFGGGRFNGLGGGPRPQRMDPGGAGGRRARGGVFDDGPRIAGQGAVRGGTDARAQRAMARLIARGWTPEAAATAVGQAVEESGVRSDGPLGDTKRFGTGDDAAHGMFQWRGGRFRELKRFAEARGVPWTDFDAQVDFFDQERKGRSGAERNWHSERDLNRGNRIGKLFEGYAGGLQAQREAHARRQLELYRRGGTPIPKAEGGGDGDTLPNGAPRVLKPNSMRDAPGLTMDEANQRREGLKGVFTRRAEVLADPNDERRQGEKPFYSDEDDRRAARDLGIALRATRAKQEAQRERMRLDGARVGAAAAQAGVVGAQVNGSVTTVIEKAGPEAKAKTSVNGNLFQEVRTQNGSQMRKAD